MTRVNSKRAYTTQTVASDKKGKNDNRCANRIVQQSNGKIVCVSKGN